MLDWLRKIANKTFPRFEGKKQSFSPSAISNTNFPIYVPEIRTARGSVTCVRHWTKCSRSKRLTFLSWIQIMEGRGSTSCCILGLYLTEIDKEAFCITFYPLKRIPRSPFLYLWDYRYHVRCICGILRRYWIRRLCCHSKDSVTLLFMALA